MPRRVASRLLRGGLVVVVLLGLVTSVSVVRYVLDNPGDPVQQSVASWARNNRLGWAVDGLERLFHSDPPSTDPADELGLDDLVTTVPGTTVPPGPAVPDDIEPVVTPALEGEGRWRPLQTVRSETAVWAMSLRPSRDYPSVVASVAVWDPTSMRTALHNGSEIPGAPREGRWTNGTRVAAAARPALVAAFNGGFRFEHGGGGYVTEGREMRPMKRGLATLAVGADGIARLGRWGIDLVDDGSWTTMRQNLPPVVTAGRVSIDDHPGTDWGEDYGNVKYTFRSALCRRTDGLFAFVAVGNVNIRLLAETLVLLGCDVAMQLDINGTWPQFAVYSGFGSGDREGRLLDRRMGNRNRYLNKSTKDFFALYDPVTLPAGAVE